MNKVESCVVQDIFLTSKTRVVFSPITYTKTTSIGILIGAGSITEDTDSLEGYAHFLEHMIFKGTDSLDFEKINKEFEKMGAYVNAFTGKYYTLFYVHCLEDFAAPCLNLFLQMVFESTLPKEEIEKEKKVVIEEINNYKDNPEDYLIEEFYSHTFKNSFFGTPILGTPKTIKSITQKSLNRYYKQYYLPENCLISVAGKFDKEQILENIEHFFSKKTAKITPFQIKKTIPFHSGVHTFYKADLEQAHICLGINTQAVGASKHSLKIFNTILGGMSSSRLYLGVREKKALCYNIDSSIYTDPNTGFINIFSSTQPHQIQELLDSLLHELASFKKKPIDEEELLIAKNQMKSKIAFRQESISQSMLKAASQYFFYGKVILDTWTVEKIDALTIDDFQKIYNNISVKDMSLHMLLPSKTKQHVALKPEIL